MGKAEEFFEQLGLRTHEPLLGKVTGRARFDLFDGGRTESWLVDVQRGDVTVSPDGAEDADCSIRMPKTLFEKLCTGEANAMASVLRGAMVCTGDIELLFAIQRVLPGPPGGQRREPAQ